VPPIDVSPAEAHRCFTGHSVGEIIATCLAEHGLTDTDGSLAEWNEARFAEFGRSLVPMPGMPAVIAAIEQPNTSPPTARRWGSGPASASPSCGTRSRRVQSRLAPRRFHIDKLLEYKRESGASAPVSIISITIGLLARRILTKTASQLSIKINEGTVTDLLLTKIDQRGRAICSDLRQ
jgi:hypothetical protein